MNASLVLGPVLGTLHVLTHLILTAALSGWFLLISQVTDEETKTKEVEYLAQGHAPLSVVRVTDKVGVKSIVYKYMSMG